MAGDEESSAGVPSVATTELNCCAPIASLTAGAATSSAAATAARPGADLTSAADDVDEEITEGGWRRTRRR